MANTEVSRTRNSASSGECRTKKMETRNAGTEAVEDQSTKLFSSASKSRWSTALGVEKYIEESEGRERKNKPHRLPGEGSTS